MRGISYRAKLERQEEDADESQELDIFAEARSGSAFHHRTGVEELHIITRSAKPSSI